MIETTVQDSVAIVVLSRDKVNAINLRLVEEFGAMLERYETDNSVSSVVLTGRGKFFSFGFDVPEFLEAPRDNFEAFLKKFTSLYRYIFTYPKPVVAALGGHAIAGGCMLATACDRRIMASGGAKISLNEIAIGVPVFAGSAEMLKFCAGEKNAQEILYSGAMYTADEALPLGLVDRVVELKECLGAAIEEARELGEKGEPFAAIKHLLRIPVAEDWIRREGPSIREFLNIWYSPEAQEKLKEVVIRD